MTSIGPNIIKPRLHRHSFSFRSERYLFDVVGMKWDAGERECCRLALTPLPDSAHLTNAVATAQSHVFCTAHEAHEHHVSIGKLQTRDSKPTDHNTSLHVQFEKTRTRAFLSPNKLHTINHSITRSAASFLTCRLTSRSNGPTPVILIDTDAKNHILIPSSPPHTPNPYFTTPNKPKPYSRPQHPAKPYHLHYTRPSQHTLASPQPPLKDPLKTQQAYVICA